MLEGSLPHSIAKLFYGGTLIALTKKDGDIRPITRRFVAKCANITVIDKIGAVLAPIQVEVGDKGGSEAEVHATRRYLESAHDQPDHIIAKLDFRKAFNCLRRDSMLEAVAQLVPEIFAFCLNVYSCQPIIMLNNSSGQVKNDMDL